MREQNLTFSVIFDTKVRAAKAKEGIHLQKQLISNILPAKIKITGIV